MKFYGSLENRFMENEADAVSTIEVGTDVTEYMWSDRNCYYVTKVENQKHVFVKKYEVIASRDEGCKGGLGSQNWKYFKSRKEADEYLLKHGVINEMKKEYNEPQEIELVFRYGKWRVVHRCDYLGNPYQKPYYAETSGKLRFGVKDYHYDWEF